MTLVRYIVQPSAIAIVHGEKLLPDGTLSLLFRSCLRQVDLFATSDRIKHLILVGGARRKSAPPEAEVACRYMKALSGGRYLLERYGDGSIVLETESRTLEEQVLNVRRLIPKLPQPGMFNEKFKHIFVIASAKHIDELQRLYRRLYPEIYTEIEWRSIGELPLFSGPLARFLSWFSRND